MTANTINTGQHEPVGPNPATGSSGLEPPRLPNEGSRAYDRFLIFIRIGPQRTLPQVATKLGVSLFSTEKMSAKYDWFRRAEEFDARLEGINSELWQAQQREAAQRRAQQELVRQQTFANLAAKFARKIDLLLDCVGVEVIEQQMEDGTTKRVVQAKGVRNLAALAIFARAYERLACLAVIDKVEESHAKIRKPEETTGPEGGEIIAGTFGFGGRMWGDQPMPELPTEMPARFSAAEKPREVPPPAFAEARGSEIHPTLREQLRAAGALYDSEQDADEA